MIDEEDDLLAELDKLYGPGKGTRLHVDGDDSTTAFFASLMGCNAEREDH